MTRLLIYLKTKPAHISVDRFNHKDLPSITQPHSPVPVELG